MRVQQGRAPRMMLMMMIGHFYYGSTNTAAAGGGAAAAAGGGPAAGEDGSRPLHLHQGPTCPKDGIEHAPIRGGVL